MRFRRNTSAASGALATDSAAASTPDDGSIPLVDLEGQAFELLRSTDLGASIWRASVVTELVGLDRLQTIVVAAYTPEELEAARPLMQRFMTIVLAMGLGPRHASRALMLGAVGYLDGSSAPEEIRGRFGDAVARIRIRRLRAAAA